MSDIMLLFTRMKKSNRTVRKISKEKVQEVMNKKNQQNKVFVPLDLIADAIEMADDEWNQYLDIEEDWYSFQEEQYRQIARDWCESHGFAYDGMENEKEEPEDLDSGENLAWEEVRTEHIVQDEWIDFRKSAYRFPDGTVFEPYYSYSRRDYVVIAASDEEGRYLCVRQFRQGIGEVTTEFPAGGIERKDGREYGSDRDSELLEDALAAAKRELQEETGYVSDHWKHLLTIPSNATLADNYAYIFLAENCRKSGEQKLDETEFLNVRTYTPDEIEEMISRGRFQQAVHVLAWLLARRK